MAILQQAQRRGFSLLELTLATSLTAAALVPALRILRQAMDVSGELETRQLTATYCLSKLEEYLCRTAATWNEGTVSGNFAADGYDSVRFRVETSDDLASGGMPDQLMAVSVVVWSDENGNQAVDAGEIQTSMRSKIALMATYQNAAEE